MAYISKRNTRDGIKPIGSNLYGTCSTASGTATKTVVMPDFNVLVEGVTIHVKFASANTAQSPLLAVGSTSAKPIQRNGSSSGVWQSGSVVSFTYDGANWVQNDADASEGDKTYVYTQQTPSAVWTVTHGLNKYPSISVVDSAGTVVVGDYSYSDLNTAVLTFSGAFSGKAYFN